MQDTRDSISLGWGLYGCGNILALKDPQLGDVLKEFLEKSGFTVFVYAAHVFPGEGGASAMAIIGESSADFHAWPEVGTIHVRLFYCDYTRNNRSNADRFIELCKGHFHPKKIIPHAPVVFMLEHPDLKRALA